MNFLGDIHILKCFESTFHDIDLVQYNNKFIDFKFYKCLFEVDTTPEFAVVQVCHKITFAHIQSSHSSSLMSN